MAHPSRSLVHENANEDGTLALSEENTPGHSQLLYLYYHNLHVVSIKSTR
jgi:hypothetical protein